MLLDAAIERLYDLNPATITITPGGLYRLWFVALNSKGKSGPGPVQNWTAP